MNRDYRVWAMLLILAIGLFFIHSSAQIALSQDPAPAQKIESDDPRVIQAGAWSNQNAAAASNGGYLFSGGAEEDVLALAFVGSAIEIIYVAGPQFGTLAIEVDGTVLRTVITTREKIEYGQVARVDYLSDEPHNVKVYAQAGGVIAVDAFVITPNSPTTLPANNDEAGGVQASTCAPLNVIHRVSVSSDGQQSNAVSEWPDISADGRYIAFASGADNLVSGDTNLQEDIFVYDRQTCQTSVVSISSTGELGIWHSDQVTISTNGRYIVFTSDASNLVTGDTNMIPDIFVHDRQTAITTRVNVATGGVQANGFSGGHAISADGRYVLFTASASNLVGGDTNNGSDVFVHDRQTATTSRVSVGTGGTQAAGASGGRTISADGRYVAFESNASNVVAGDTNGFYDVFVYDRQSGFTTRVSVATGGTQAMGGDSAGPMISPDGRFIAFQSAATNLVVGDTNGFSDAFVHDRQTATTTRISVATGGTQAMGGDSRIPDISADGRFIAFQSAATNLVVDDTNGVADIFVHDHQLMTTRRVSVSASGTQSNGVSGYSPNVVISADGRYVVFESLASNLVNGDTNSSYDIFVTPINPTPTDTLALFNPPVEQVNLLDTLADNPAAERYTAFSAYAPPTTAGQWVMGDWNGDGLKTPGVYMNGPFYYTNRMGETQASDWRSLWIGINGPPVSGRFNGGLPNECIGAVQQASLSGQTVFVLYFTCDLSGNTAPAISSQWLSAVLPTGGGFSGTHQFKAGDFNSDGVDSIAVRRGNYIAYGNIAPATGPATFPLAQYIGTPATHDEGIFVVGDWDASGADSFGLFYQNGEFFYRNDLDFNSGAYGNQSVGTPFGNSGVQATTWH